MEDFNSVPYVPTPEEVDARIARLQAESTRALAEASKFNLEAEFARLHIAERELDLSKKTYEDEVRLAGDNFYHLYRFNTAVGEESVKKCMNMLSTWHRLEPGCTITVIFNSPGGTVNDGLALFDYLQELRHSGHRLITKAQGIAASMAGILLQAGDERVMSTESWMLIHETQFGAMGSFGEVEDRVKWIERVQSRILDIFAGRAAESNAAKPITRKELERNWRRTDWWIPSDEALKFGLIDSVDSTLKVGG